MHWTRAIGVSQATPPTHEPEREEWRFWWSWLATCFLPLPSREKGGVRGRNFARRTGEVALSHTTPVMQLCCVLDFFFRQSMRPYEI